MTLAVALIVVGTAAVLGVAFGLRDRLPAFAVIGLLAAGGALVAAGALLARDHAGGGDWVLALAGLALLMPLHAWALLGPLGKGAESQPGRWKR